MITKRTKQTCATALGALALTLLFMPCVAQAGPRGGRASVVAIDERGGRDASNGAQAGRGRGGLDDPANHDANDNRGAMRNGADDPVNHDVGDDNNRNRRRGRGR